MAIRAPLRTSAADELMSPGTYLRKRREAAGVALVDLAALMAGLPWRVREPELGDVERLVARLAEAEDDRDNLTLMQAAMLLNAFPLDVDIYEALLLHHHAVRAPIHGVPRPRVCRRCACSDRDGCHTDRGMCAWASADLCTACERVEQLEAEIAGQPAPFVTVTAMHPAAELNPATPFAAGRELGRSPIPPSERIRA